MRILLTGGGSGGHLFPLIAIARSIKKFAPRYGILEYGVLDLKFLYVGPKDDWIQELLEKEKIKGKIILSGKIRRDFSISSIIANLKDIFYLFIGFFQALYRVWQFMPDIIVGKGGYGSFSVLLVGIIYRIPLVIHESDTVPGFTNRFFSYFAKKIIVSFLQTKKYFPKQKIIVSGNPIRREILEGTKQKARETFGLSPDRPTLFIIGGSQGARTINDLILSVLPELLSKYQIIHQAGKRNFKEVNLEAHVVLEGSENKIFYHSFPFLDERQAANAYTVADLIISRAGSGTIFEIAASEKPSIIIPLSTAAAGHQLKNAYAFAKNGATIVLEEQNLTPNLFLNRVASLLENPEKIKEISKKAKEFSKPKAAKKIAEVVLKLIT